MGDLLQQCGDIGRGYNLKERIGSVVFKAADLTCGVVEGQAFLGAEGSDIGLIERFLGCVAEVVFVVEMD